MCIYIYIILINSIWNYNGFCTGIIIRDDGMILNAGNHGGSQPRFPVTLSLNTGNRWSCEKWNCWIHSVYLNF